MRRYGFWRTAKSKRKWEEATHALLPVLTKRLAKLRLENAQKAELSQPVPSAS